MAKSILAIYNGNDYQARVFWLHACQVLHKNSKIEKVGYEIDGVKSFDDVAVIYKSPVLGERSEKIMADYWQVKYHVDAGGVLTFEELTNPAFINATANSILQRLHQVQSLLDPDGTGTRFHFVSPWYIQSDDPLAKLVSNNGHEIRLDILFSDTSVMKRVRETWKRHLGLSNDDELECVIRPFRIHASYPSLQQLRDDINLRLSYASLKPVDESAASNPYDELIRKLRGLGQTWFSRDEIEEICRREGLWECKEENPEKAVCLGIRSFTRWAENMENETDRMLNLVPYFNSRSIQSEELWMEKIYPDVDGFFQTSLKERVLYTLRLDCHLSIAFGAGYALGTKSGFEIAPVQKTFSGLSVWQINKMAQPLSNLWSFTDLKISNTGSDIGLAISITHDIATDVRDYIEHCLPEIGQLIACHPQAGVSSSAISDGDHAYNFAIQLVQWLRQNRNSKEKQVVLHIFSATPNGFMFLLGQQAKVLGKIQLYEFDFDHFARNNYQPSFIFSQD